MSSSNVQNSPITVVSRYLDGQDHLDVFVCGNNGLVYMSRWSEGSTWSSIDGGWRCLGGITLPPRARVSAVARKPDQLDLFVCGKDGKVYTSWWSKSSGWYAFWKCLSGSFPPGVQVTAVARGAEQLDLFAVGKDGDICTCYWSKGHGWSSTKDGWKSLGGFQLSCANVAAVARKPDLLDVFTCGTHGHVYTKWWSKVSGWSVHWKDLGKSLLQPGAYVTAVARKPDQLDLFACGSDGCVYTSWWAKGGHGWSGIPNNWACLGGIFPPGANVSVLAHKPEHLDLFVCGRDGHVYTTWWDKLDGWKALRSDWKDISGEYHSGAIIASVTRYPEHLDLFTCSMDGELYTSWWKKGSGWSGTDGRWRSLGQLPARSDKLPSRQNDPPPGIRKKEENPLSCTVQLEEFSVGIICPLPIEVAAMRQMLDEYYSTEQFPRDPNLYHLGRIGEHKVVIAGLPEGLTGISSATTVAEMLWTSFHSVKALLLVGIGGGVPTTKNDMRLGDVVVSCPAGKYGGVVQYDFGKSLSESRFEHTGALNSPPRELLSTLAALKANHLLNGVRQPDYLTYLEASQSNPNLKPPKAENDLLFEREYNHAGESDCTSCDKKREIKRIPREANGPVIHYGTIASANKLMRDSKMRDLYNKDYDERILCFEMEAAGLMNSTPCLVIRGISDYADSHKREDHAWHGYAAAAAAAFAKEFINTIPSGRLKGMSIIADAIERES